MLTNGEYKRAAPALACDVSQPALQNDLGMERIWFLSIRHTGTHYLFEHLQRLGYANGFINWSMHKLVRPAYRTNYFIHSHIEITPSYQYKTTERCVVTLRNPVEVYRSHVYRYPWLPEQFIVYILDAFYLLHSLIWEHDAYVFRVDAEDQQDEVDQLADWLGVEDYQYIEVSRTTKGTRDKGECINPELFAAPVPEEINEIAERYGY